MRAVVALVVLLTSTIISAADPPSVFDADTVIDLKVTAPWDDLISKARANPEYTVAGKLTYTDDDGRERTLDQVTVALRGHTSMQARECDFPKLKLSLRGDRTGTPFASVSTLKIGTHCGDRDDGTLTEKYGRWANEKATHREAFVYRLLNVMKVPTLDARPARITYADSSSGDAPLVRNALLLEDDDAAMARMGAKEQVVETAFTNAREAFAPRDAIRLALGEAMIGNFDWCVRFFKGDMYRCDNRHPLWNVMAFRTPRGLVPLPYDFDLSGLVTGRHTWFGKVFNDNFSPTSSEAEVEVLQQVQRTRLLFSRQDIDAVRAEFVANKGAAMDLVRSGGLDAEGRRFAEAYLNAFFAAIDDDRAFYRPMVTEKGAQFFVNADRQQPACNGELVPVGTVVSDPLETRNDMVRVNVIDTTWAWGPPKTCDAIHQNSVWVSSKVLSSDLPR